MAAWFRRASTPGTAAADPANAQAAHGKPLLLIGFNEATKKWEVGQEAVAVLQGIKGPLCTVSVCGRARQGKSFLLNQLLGKFTGIDRPKGFVVSATHQSCTRGIWIWSIPISLTNSEGVTCNTILMDCEGVDAVDQGQQHSAQIFSLAVLLSSIFIFNQVGAIDAIAIERLAMVCELAKRIKDRSLAGRGGNNQVDFSPAFVWLLRDFQLILEKDGRKISGAEYLEDALKPTEGGQADLENRNQMRQTIKAVFPDRDVVTIVRPALTEQKLQKLDTLPANELRPEFRKDLDVLAQVLRGKLRPLEVQGHMLNGRTLGSLASAYVTAVNQGAVPQLVTAWQGIARAESQKAYDAAVAKYKEQFQYQGITEEHALYTAYKAAVDASLQDFKGSAMGDARLLSELEGKLRQDFESKYLEAKHKLAASGEKLATEMLAAETVKLRNLMNGPHASVDAVESELHRFLDEYDLKVAAGPFKYKRAAEFLMNVPIGGFRSIVKELINAREQAVAKAQHAETAIAQLRADVQRLSDAEGRASDAQQQLLAAQQECARLSGQLEAKARHVSTLESELATARQQDAAAGAAQHKLQQDLASAHAESKKLQGQLAELASIKSRVEQLQQQLSEAGRRESELMQQQAAAQEEVTRIGSQLTTEKAAADRLRAENAAGRAELEKVREDLAAAREDLEGAQQATVGQSHLQGQLDEERRKVTKQMQVRDADPRY
eukprot:GHUV01028546.1.p1 GENE.GHUV01028546.1~~GHUV01028546.1.p1  ORF type:complete len:721 (+),score=264.72 GHUV01028546.1:893-3055(+)